MLLSLPVLTAVANAQSAPDFIEAKRLADPDEASLGPVAGTALLASLEKLLHAGVAACATPDSDMSALVVVMETDRVGIVVRTWLQGASPLAVRFRTHAMGKRLAAPAIPAFHSSIELSFTP